MSIFENIKDEIKTKKEEFNAYFESKIHESFGVLKNNIKSVDIKGIEFTQDSQYDDEGGSYYYIDEMIVKIDKQKIEELAKNKNIDLTENGCYCYDNYYTYSLKYEEQFYSKEERESEEDENDYLSYNIFTDEELEILKEYRYSFLDSFDASDLPDTLGDETDD